jgi:ATP-dependent Zn protease
VFACVALLISTFFNLWPAPSLQTADISYSAFLEQVRADNVSKVHITADSIYGSLIKPLFRSEPPLRAESKQSGSSTSAEGGHHMAPHAPSAGLAQSSPVISHYSKFRTTFPAVVGDPGLMTLLESHHVTVDVSAPSKPWFLEVLIDWIPMLMLIASFGGWGQMPAGVSPACSDSAA